MKPSKFLRSFLLAAGSSLLAASSASAQTTLTWDITPGTIGAGDSAITGGTGAWNTSNGNWTSDVGATNVTWDADNSNNDTAVFGGTAGTVTLGETIDLKTLSLTNLSTTNKYTIAGSTLAFSSGGSITTASTNSSNFTDFAFISSAITGAPNIVHGFSGANNQLVFNPSSGSVALGTISGSGVTRLAGSTTGNSLVGVSNNNAKLKFSSGTWTLTGTASAYEHFIEGGNLIISTGTMTNTNRSTNLTGGTLHYNNPAAIRDNNAGAGGDNNFRLRGGSLDNTSGAAITTSTWNPGMNWEANWTFIGSNGANSNLYLGNGAVALNGGTRQVTVQNAATTLAVGGVLSNGGLTKAGAGTLELRNATSTYNGATAVNAGTLAVTGTGSINTTSAINVAAGGTLRYNSSTALTVAPTLAGNGTSNRAVLGGTGTINATVTLDNLGDVLSPCNSPGTQIFGATQTWASFSYDWEVNNSTGTTAGTAFDQIGITGGLALSGGSGSYILNVLGLTAGDVEGSTPNFSEINRSWTILTTTAVITSFDAANWTISTAGFSSPDAGTWALNESSGNLVLSYTAIPEPSAALLGGLGLLGLLRRRR